ncbi:MAG: ribose 5-phosphate isomerase B [Clostridiales bacterium]|nr:ribose 5-phosphate isomerase B [Clostridiales bacterium]
MMKIGFGCDHTAVELKNILMEHMKSQGYECVDYGSYSPEEKRDYPVSGRLVAEAIRRGEVDKGVLICGTGVGISLAANKVPGIRAGVCSEPYTARLITEHNDCQIVAMGARVVGSELAKMICDSFFSAQFQGGRHAKRLGMIAAIEEDYGYADAPVK